MVELGLAFLAIASGGGLYLARWLWNDAKPYYMKPTLVIHGFLDEISEDPITRNSDTEGLIL